MSTGLPDCLALLRLRVAVCSRVDRSTADAFEFVGPEVISALYSARLDALGAATVTPWLPCFQRVWKTCSELPASHAFFVPPLYETADLAELLRQAVTGLFLRERGIITGQGNNVGHLVLGGLEGTGKTTIARALSVGAAVLLDYLVPITWSYEDDPELQSGGSGKPFSIRQMLARVSWCLESDTLSFSTIHDVPTSDGPNRGINAAVQGMASARHSHAPFFVLDELNVLFVESQAAATNRAPVCNELCAACRIGRSFAVITGSSSSMQSLLFQDFSDTPDVWRPLGYPSFNGSLFVFHCIAPLRSAPNLARFVAARYPEWVLDEHSVRVLLCYTGGIGRLVHQVWAAKRTETAPPWTSLVGLPSIAALGSLSRRRSGKDGMPQSTTLLGSLSRGGSFYVRCWLSEPIHSTLPACSFPSHFVSQ